MATYNDYGIVLSSYKFGESDKILNIYTKTSGLVKAVCKGSRKLTSSFGSKVDQLSCCYFQFAKGKNLYTVCECEQVKSFALLRSDLTRLTYGMLFIEIVSNFAHEEESESKEVYELLYSSLDKLQRIINPELLAIEFLLEFLSIHGYKPQFDTCVSCSKVINLVDTIKSYSYSSILGGLLCSGCADLIDHKAVSLDILKILIPSSSSQLSVPTNKDIRLILELLKEHVNMRAKNKIKSFDLAFSL